MGWYYGRIEHRGNRWSPLNPPACAFGPSGGSVRPAGHRRQAPHAVRLPGTERSAGDVHLQPLSLCHRRSSTASCDCRELAALGVGSVAIMSNDATAYPEDSFANMALLARQLDFPSPTCMTNRRRWPAPMAPVHTGFLRLQQPARTAISRPPRRLGAQLEPSGRAARTLFRHAPDRRYRARSGSSDTVDRLLDQMARGRRATASRIVVVDQPADRMNHGAGFPARAPPAGRAHIPPSGRPTGCRADGK